MAASINAMTIGRHSIRVLGQGEMFEVALRGNLTHEEVTQFLDFIDQRSAGHRYLLVTGDMSQVGAITAEARKLLLQRGFKVPLRGIVYYNTSFAGKVMNKLVISAYTVLSGADVPLHFVKNEEEARAWLEKRRRELEAERAGSRAGSHRRM